MKTRRRRGRRQNEIGRQKADLGDAGQVGHFDGDERALFVTVAWTSENVRLTNPECPNFAEIAIPALIMIIRTDDHDPAETTIMIDWIA